MFPYDADHLLPISQFSGAYRWLWPTRTYLGSRVTFSKRTYFEEGRPWWEWHQIALERIKTPLTITFAEIATHNHFVLDRGGKVFNRTAPVIKLPAGSTVEEHLGLLGLLNSSVACFWFKQVCHNKGSTVDQHGARQRTSPFEDFYALNSTKVAEFPLPQARPTTTATHIDWLSTERSKHLPNAVLAHQELPNRHDLDLARHHTEQLWRLMVGRQEELDWECYGLYGLLPPGVPADSVQEVSPGEVKPGERAFEIVLARRIAAGKEQTTWFERHGSTPITEIPSHWPEGYRRVVARRIELIEQDKSIGLIERPEFKRRWNSPKWEDQEQASLRDWLLTRIEAPALWPASADQAPQLTSTSRLADAVQRDADFMQIAALYAGHTDFDLPQLVAELVAAEAVPALPVQCYADTGLRKRAQWQDTWALQRREDAIDAQVVADNADTWREAFNTQARERFHIAAGQALSDEAQTWVDQQLAAEIKRHQDERKANEVGPIPVPPKYQSKDFLKADFWRLRGGLDVSKERWISYPGCERGADGSLVIAWAGWNHLQQATAVAGYYMNMKEGEGWEPARLQPLLAALLELVPWLEQWHNEIDPVFGERMGHYYKGFVTEEARALGFTLDDLRAWKPAATATKRGRKKKDAT